VVALFAARVQNHVVDAARKLVGGVLGVVSGAAKHAVWYVRYQVEGITRDDEDERRDPAAEATDQV
jgi:hypothetical protein